jgi:hypothetical protein
MPDETPTPKTPAAVTPGESDPDQSAVTEIRDVPVTSVATTGKRQAFRNIRRQLQEQELLSPGVQKLLLEELETADARCEILEVYVDRFHEADKRAAVLEEKLKTQKAFEIIFGVGVGVGCAIVGLAPFFWDGSGRGPIVLAVGLVLTLGATTARIVKQ